MRHLIPSCLMPKTPIAANSTPHARRRSAKIVLVLALAASAPLYLAAATLAPHSNTNSHAQGYLGVEFHDLTDDQVAFLHLQGPHGAEIILVDHDGPAGKAGLQPHDVVVQMDGAGIDNADDLRRRIRESTPGKTISLAILRFGRMMTLSAKLANREELERQAWQPQFVAPSDSDAPSPPTEKFLGSQSAAHAPVRGQSFIGTVLRSGPYTGLTLESMEPQLAGYFGAPANTGLLVHGVDTNSPGYIAGLRAGDVVLRVDSIAVATPSEWTKRLKSSSGRAVNLTILREKREMTISLQPDLKRHTLLEWPKIF